MYLYVINLNINPLKVAPDTNLGKKFMKKLSIFLLALVTCAGITQAAIVNGSCGANLTWSLNTKDSTLTITGSGEMTSRPWSDYKSYIKYVSLPDGLTSIGSYAFDECRGLTSVTIPESVTTIGARAFAVCTGLTSVTIPNSVTSIGSTAFLGSGLSSPVYNAHVFAFMPTSYSGAYTILDGIESIAGFAFGNCSGLTSVTIPNSVTSIGDYAFDGCSGLTSVTIGNSVTSIGNDAFYGCSGLTSVTIPNSVTSIGNDAFAGCHGLTSITIPNSVTSIGEGAFWDCIGLTSVTISNSVTFIGNDAFYNCTGLTSVHIFDIAAWCAISFGSSIYANPLYCAHNLYLNETLVTDLIIPNDVTSIGDYTFSGCTGLTSVTIPNSVTSIGNQAFAGCHGLTSITIPNSVTSIGDGAFSVCWGLIAIDVAADNPNYCSEEGVLFNKDKTTLVAYPGGKQGAYAIPSSVTSIGDNAFENCIRLTSVTIPNSVTSIGDNAFEYCDGLTSIEIPNSVTSIGSSAFYNCSSLTSITNYATTPQTIESNVFEYVNKSTCKLYVPIEAVSAYQAAPEWQDLQIAIAIPGKADPDNTSAYYTTFFDSSNKYRLSAGMEAYTAVINGDVLSLTKVAEGGEVIPANEAFILKSNAANLTMDVTEDDPVAVGPNALLGVDAATPAPANCYVLSGKSSDNSVQGLGFYQFSGALGAHKAYLVLGGGASGAPRRLRFSFNETNTATGVEQVPSNQVQSTKVIENGVLYIMYNGTKYNVQGTRVE